MKITQIITGSIPVHFIFVEDTLKAPAKQKKGARRQVALKNDNKAVKSKIVKKKVLTKRKK
jgi:hypothetical protein